MSDEESVLERLVRMETKLDMALVAYHDRLNDHENRLRILEKARWPLPSAAVLISLISVILVAVTLLV